MPNYNPDTFVFLKHQVSSGRRIRSLATAERPVPWSASVEMMNPINSGRICGPQVECRLHLFCMVSDLYIGGGNSVPM